MNRDRYIKFIVPAILAVWFVALCIYYLTSYQYHFFWQEQNQIFLYSADYLHSYYQRPAWLACMAGDYLTQFYYYRYAGPLILVSVLIITTIALYISLRSMLPRWAAGGIVIASALWLSLCTLDASYRLSSLLCVTGGVLSYLLIRPLKGGGLVLLPVVFMITGYGWIITAVLALGGLIRRPSKVPAILLVVGIAVTLGVAKWRYDMPYATTLEWPGIGTPCMPEKAFEQTLAVDNEYYFGNLDAAAALAREADKPNEITSFYYYLSQARQNSLPDSLLSYPIRDLGTLQQIGEETPVHIINMMNELYYQLGDMTYTERAAMMRNVFSPQNRNVRMIKRLAEANLVSGDTVAAMKYLRILSKTHAYRQWAECRMPGKMTDAVKHDIERRKKLINRQGGLRVGDNCRTILTLLLDSNPDNILALDYLLCTDLLLKDMDNFKLDYDRYCMSRGKPRLKPLYQQALMIYLTGTNAPPEDWQKYIQMPSEVQRFHDYSHRRGDNAYDDTYWYYFDTHK